LEAFAKKARRRNSYRGKFEAWGRQNKENLLRVAIRVTSAISELSRFICPALGTICFMLGFVGKSFLGFQHPDVSYQDQVAPWIQSNVIRFLAYFIPKHFVKFYFQWQFKGACFKFLDSRAEAKEASNIRKLKRAKTRATAFAATKKAPKRRSLFKIDEKDAEMKVLGALDRKDRFSLKGMNGGLTDGADDDDLVYLDCVEGWEFDDDSEFYSESTGTRRSSKAHETLVFWEDVHPHERHHL
jgi:hypothetical protein